ncbi:Mobile element protein [Candidatus Electronema halotolerans]
MNQLGFFDFYIRLSRIDKAGDPLVKINKAIDWEIFRPILEEAKRKSVKSNAGAKGYDSVMMFKILILQSLYNLSGKGMEYQILDRYSFSRFLGLRAADKVPDATTIWLFRETLTKAGKIEELFSVFDEFLDENGYQARKGQIVDASIVNAPIQRNSRKENKQIKNGEQPEGWSENKQAQKDTDARWTKKNGRSFFGYKNHISVDVKHKFIRKYAVTSAEVHDSNIFEELLDPDNTSRDIYADSAYRSEKKLNWLNENGYREHLNRKGTRSRKLTEWEKQGNRTRSKIRSRIEHVFGIQAQRAGNMILRGTGFIRAAAKIGLRNLTFNIDRYGTLNKI